MWLRGVDLNHRPLGYEPNELPGCSTPQKQFTNYGEGGQREHVKVIQAKEIQGAIGRPLRGLRVSVQYTAQDIQEA